MVLACLEMSPNLHLFLSMFLLFAYICIAVENPILKSGRIWVP